MRRPRIGIPLSLDDRGRWRAGRDYHYIDRSYADAIARAGGIPLQLPIQSDPAPLLEILDGLLVPGGDDLLPDEPLPAQVELDPVAEAQLAFDQALIEAARPRGLPILGICYGMQLLARLAGGELHSHLPSERPDAEEHRHADPDDRHDLSVEPDSRLAAVLGVAGCSVNSLHHQAVRRVGHFHRVVARSPDGVIEAIESVSQPDAESLRWELGVQWHPEKLPSPESDRLFRHFVEACAAGRRR